jgi:phospholipid/cholesterol/gamma-HCH transport system ATP-binding protein
LNDRIGMLFQQNALFDSLPVWENIAFRLIANGMARDEARAEAEALLPRVGLPAANADLFPADLSGGMQKRVGFARAIATKPDILLLDNPTAGLDPILSARVDDMISALARESGACVISVTSNMVGITEAYDEIGVMHEGQLRWHGSAKAAETDDNAWLRQLLAGSREGPISTLTAAA